MGSIPAKAITESTLLTHESICAHTACEHVGNGKLKCRLCGAIEPIVVSTIRVKQEDYETLQSLYTEVRHLMQAKTGQYFQDRLLALGALVGVPPKLMPIIENDDERVNALIDAVLTWYDAHKGFTGVRDQLLAGAVSEYKGGMPDAPASTEPGK